jgi:hypothetical protein
MSKPRKLKAAPSSAAAKPASEMILYQTDDNQTRIEVRLENETVWLTQAQMAELFQTTIPNVSMHIRNVYEEGELERGATDKESLTVQPAATVKEFLIVRQEGSRVLVRRILRNYGYPPDKQDKATQTVLEQAKLLCVDWAGE